MALALLIRHALTDVTGKRLSGRTPGLHLSDAGRVQAERLAERLRPLRLAAAYSSPLERCVETAEIALAGRDLRVEKLPDLLEVDYGRWTGRTIAPLYRTALWKRLLAAPSSIRFPGGETLGEVQRRCVGAIDRAASAHPNGTVALFAHADVIRVAVAHYAGLHLDLFQRIIVSPASVSAVLIGDRIPRVVRLNDTGSLEDLAARRPATRARTSPGRRPPARGGALR
jgi:probable phosphomutase (TIGR03848 family)